MPTPKLYHVPQTRSTRPLILYYELKELYGDRIPDLDVVTIPQEQFRSADRPAILLELNPNGKVPVMTHGDIVMFEGCAMCLYLLDLFDEDSLLAPADDAKFRAMLYQFSVYTPGTLDNLTALSSPIQRVFPKDNPKPLTDPDIMAMNKEAWIKIAEPYLSSILGDRDFFYGDSFTALDVIVGFFLIGLQFKRSDWMAPYPKLSAYVNKLKQRPMFSKAFDLDY